MCLYDYWSRTCYPGLISHQFPAGLELLFWGDLRARGETIGQWNRDTGKPWLRATGNLVLHAIQITYASLVKSLHVSETAATSSVHFFHYDLNFNFLIKGQVCLKTCSSPKDRPVEQKAKRHQSHPTHVYIYIQNGEQNYLKNIWKLGSWHCFTRWRWTRRAQAPSKCGL